MSKDDLSNEMLSRTYYTLCKKGSYRFISYICELLKNINANLELKVAIEQELLDCLCPVEPPPGAECNCFVTGGGTATLPNDAIPDGAQGKSASLGFNACPGCNFRANVTFSTMIDGSQTLFGRELVELECDLAMGEATITGAGTFGSGAIRQDVTFILTVNDPMNTFMLRIFDLADNLIFSTGADPVLLTGRGIEVRDCPV